MDGEPCRAKELGHPEKAHGGTVGVGSSGVWRQGLAAEQRERIKALLDIIQRPLPLDIAMSNQVAARTYLCLLPIREEDVVEDGSNSHGLGTLQIDWLKGEVRR